MTLQASGSISLSQIAAEFGRGTSSPISLGSYFKDASSNIDGISLKTSFSGSVPHGAGQRGYIYGGIGWEGSVAGQLDAIRLSSDTMMELFVGLNQNYYGAMAVSSNSTGYFGGGQLDDIYSWWGYINKLLYATDTVIHATGASMGLIYGQRGYGVGIYGSTKGYFCGGLSNEVFGKSSSSTQYSQIDGIIFATDTPITAAANLADSKYDACSVNYGTLKGYVVGGIDYFGGTTTNIQEFTYATETRSTIAAVLSIARSSLAGTYSSTDGFFCGGTPNGGASTSTEIEGLTFSTLAATNPTASLISAVTDASAVQSSTNGYVVGGAGATPMSPSTYPANVTKLLFSNQTTSTASFGLYNERSRHVGVTMPATVSTTISPTDYYSFVPYTGYFSTGETGTPASNTFTSEIESLRFASEASINTSAVSSGGTSTHKSACNSKFAGYEFGGYSVTYSNVISGLTFSTETAKSVAVTLDSVKAKTSCVGSNTFAVIGAGYTGAVLSSNLDKFNFANESKNTITSSVTATANRGAYGNGTSGYFVGGETSLNTVFTSAIQRINHFTTVTSPLSVFLAVPRSQMGFSNSTISGYVAGGIGNGSTVLSSIEKFDFTTETNSALAITVSTTRRYLAGVNSATSSYYAGGVNSAGTLSVNEIDGHVYSSGVASNPTAALSVSRNGLVGYQSGAL